MFRNVQIRVKQANGQDPWLSFPSLAPVYLVRQETAPPPVAAPQTQLSADAQAWSVVQGAASEAVLEEFIRRFPDSVYAGFAKARLEELRAGAAKQAPEKSKNPQTAAVTSPKSVQNCRWLGGSWYSSGNGATMFFDQTHCSISGEFGTAIFHKFTGRAVGDNFDYILSRTDRSTGCTVIFYGRFINIAERTMTSHVYRTSGACGFAKNWTETLSWVRR